MKHISMERLALSIKEKRADKSIEEMEYLTGINRQLFNRIEKAKYIPSASQLQRILDILEIKLSNILEEDNLSIYASIMKNAKNESEKEGFERMISMMLCLRKYERLQD